MSAEQDSGGDIGAPLVALPVLDVMCFAEGGRSLATRPPASAIAGGERDALRTAEQPTLAPEVQRLPGVLGTAVDCQGDGAGAARVALDRRDRNGVGLAFEKPAPVPLVERPRGDDHTHADRRVAEQLRGVGGDALPQQLGKGVARALLRRALVVEGQIRTAFTGVICRKARHGSFRRGDAVEHVADDREGLGVENPVGVPHAVGTSTEPE